MISGRKAGFMAAGLAVHCDARVGCEAGLCALGLVVQRDVRVGCEAGSAWIGCEAGGSGPQGPLPRLRRTQLLAGCLGVRRYFNALEKSGAFLFFGILFGVGSVRIRHHLLRKSPGLKRPSIIFSGKVATGMVES